MPIVSNFELLLNRIANGGDPNLPSNVLFRRVVQGYFLTISNPNPTTITFQLRFTTNAATNTDFGDPNNAWYRGFVGSSVGNANHVLVVNREPDSIASVNNIQQGFLPTGTVFGAARQFLPDAPLATIQILGGQTFSIALLPNTSNPLVLGTANLAIRGYAEILVNPVVNLELIVSAEHRGTFLDNDYPSDSAESMDFDQIAYALPMFSGGSRLKV